MSTEDKDCNTCRHHAQTSMEYPACNDCLKSKDLSYWEPIMAEEKQTCANCLHSDVVEFTGPCKGCAGENWEPKGAIIIVDGDPRRIILGQPSSVSDGSTASYYELPKGATELQDLIACRNMNAQLGEIFRAAYRYGMASHSDKLRDIKKIKFYAEAEIARLEKYGN